MSDETQAGHDWNHWPLPAPCSCGGLSGYIRTVSGQDVLRCWGCATYVKCVPRTETGREVRSLRTRPAIKPSLRARVLLRDGEACWLCHATDVQLDIAHIISVDAGRAQGLSDDDLHDEENLFVLCAQCNAGMGSEPLPLRLCVRLLVARLRRGGS